jgi:hypothetical protein
MIPTMTREEYLEELKVDYILGDISIDPDDPRTTAGLTKEEVAYVRGEKE